MKKWSLFSLKIIASALVCLSGQAFGQQKPTYSNQNPISIGIVNFKKCVEDSKLGKAEQAAFDNLKNQMASILEKTEKELEQLANKLNSDAVDSMSPEAEEELKVKFQKLSVELNRYQNQYYQILNQANYRILNSLSTKVSEAAETVAKSKNLKVVFNEEACFFFDADLDLTKLVVAELDRNYVPDAKATTPMLAPAPASNPPPSPAQQPTPPAQTPSSQSQGPSQSATPMKGAMKGPGAQPYGPQQYR